MAKTKALPTGKSGKKTKKAEEKVRPTRAEAQTEAIKLKTIKPHVRETTAFGDNNHDAIDAQIEALENEMSEYEIHERFDDEGESVMFAALDARTWMDGKESDLGIGLADDWASLIVDGWKPDWK